MIEAENLAIALELYKGNPVDALLLAHQLMGKEPQNRCFSLVLQLRKANTYVYAGRLICKCGDALGDERGQLHGRETASAILAVLSRTGNLLHE